jgi:hypothetical protein
MVRGQVFSADAVDARLTPLTSRVVSIEGAHR